MSDLAAYFASVDALLPAQRRQWAIDVLHAVTARDVIGWLTFRPVAAQVGLASHLASCPLAAYLQMLFLSNRDVVSVLVTPSSVVLEIGDESGATVSVFAPLAPWAMAFIRRVDQEVGAIVAQDALVWVQQVVPGDASALLIAR